MEAAAQAEGESVQQEERPQQARYTREELLEQQHAPECRSLPPGLDSDGLSDLQAPASTADQAAPESVAPAAPDGSSSGRLRWAVKSGGIDAAQLDYLLHLCPEEERPDVARYRQPDDRKRAVVSHLMQHAATVAALGVPTEEAHLRCTRHGKPYAAANVARPPHAPNWNFNVSHEGKYVVLAAEPVGVVGVDITAPLRTWRGRRQRHMSDFWHSYYEQFSTREWATIRFAGRKRAQEAQFMRLWALKEAFVKATGQGMSFDIGQIEFTLTGATATAIVNGEPAPDWSFHMHMLGRRHWVAVARAPPSAVWDPEGLFKGTLGKVELEAEEWEAQRAAEEPPFTLLSPQELLPPAARAGYPQRQRRGVKRLLLGCFAPPQTADDADIKKPT